MWQLHCLSDMLTSQTAIWFCSIHTGNYSIVLLYIIWLWHMNLFNFFIQHNRLLSTPQLEHLHCKLHDKMLLMALFLLFIEWSSASVVFIAVRYHAIILWLTSKWFEIIVFMHFRRLESVAHRILEVKVFHYVLTLKVLGFIDVVVLNLSG